jgi:hypothetical protein
MSCITLQIGMPFEKLAQDIYTSSDNVFQGDSFSSSGYQPGGGKIEGLDQLQTPPTVNTSTHPNPTVPDISSNAGMKNQSSGTSNAGGNTGSFGDIAGVATAGLTGLVGLGQSLFSGGEDGKGGGMFSGLMKNFDVPGMVKGYASDYLKENPDFIGNQVSSFLKENPDTLTNLFQNEELVGQIGPALTGLMENDEVKSQIMGQVRPMISEMMQDPSVQNEVWNAGKSMLANSSLNPANWFNTQNQTTGSSPNWFN